MTSSSPWRNVDIELLGPSLFCAVAAERNRLVELLLRRHARQDEPLCMPDHQTRWPLDISRQSSTGTCQINDGLDSNSNGNNDNKFTCSSDSDTDADSDAGWHSGASDTEEEDQVRMFCHCCVHVYM